MQGKEIEIKLEINLSEYQTLIQLFYEKAKLLKKRKQVDVYYSPEGENYYDYGDRCLRIRTENQKSILCYKRIYDESLPTQYIEEYETQIDDADMIQHILEALHFKREIIVDKFRVEFLYEDVYLVALDKVEGLGYFLEIEHKDEQVSIETRNAELVGLVKKLCLDINRQNKEGYSNMLYRKNQE